MRTTLLFLLSLIHASLASELRPAFPVYSHDRYGQRCGSSTIAIIASRSLSPAGELAVVRLPIEQVGDKCARLLRMPTGTQTGRGPASLSVTTAE